MVVSLQIGYSLYPQVSLPWVFNQHPDQIPFYEPCENQGDIKVHTYIFSYS